MSVSGLVLTDWELLDENMRTFTVHIPRLLAEESESESDSNTSDQIAELFAEVDPNIFPINAESLGDVNSDYNSESDGVSVISDSGRSCASDCDCNCTHLVGCKCFHCDSTSILDSTDSVDPNISMESDTLRENIVYKAFVNRYNWTLICNWLIVIFLFLTSIYVTEFTGLNRDLKDYNKIYINILEQKGSMSLGELDLQKKSFNSNFNQNIDTNFKDPTKDDQNANPAKPIDSSESPNKEIKKEISLQGKMNKIKSIYRQVNDNQLHTNEIVKDREKIDDTNFMLEKVKELQILEEYLKKKEEFLLMKEQKLLQKENDLNKRDNKQTVKKRESNERSKYSKKTIPGFDEEFQKQRYKRKRNGKKNYIEILGTWYNKMHGYREESRKRNKSNSIKYSVYNKKVNKAYWYFAWMDGRENSRFKSKYQR